MESPPAQFAGRVVDVPVIRQMDLETKYVKIPQIQHIDEAVDVPVVMLRLVSHGPAGAVHRQSGHAGDQAEEIILEKRIPERVVGQIDDVPVPSVFQRGSVSRSLTPPYPTLSFRF